MKILCCCVPEDPKAIDSAKEHFEKMGVGEVEFVWCVNATVAGLATWHTYELDHPGSGFRMGSKPTGIWLAHLTAWTVAMRYPDEQVMVLETDAKFHDDWKERLARALADVPSNFDFLHPGHCCVEGHPMTHVKGEVFECKRMQCTHCYIVRRGVLPFALKTIRKCYAPIDVQMQLELFPHLKTYMVYPRVVSQFNTVLSP